MVSRALTLSLFVVTFWALPCEAQLSPPGLGEANTASWSAMGLRQDLDATARRESVTYTGFGSISDRDNFNPFAKPAIFVVNQEIYDQFRPAWLYSFALSYRRQSLYQDEPPYAAATPRARHELRLYGRYAHVLKIGAFKLVNTFRPELRTFFGAGLGPDAEDLEFRFRLRSKLAWSMDRSGERRLVASAEALSAVARERSGQWGPFKYRESRFCLYYSLAPHDKSFVFDIGYMNNLLGSGGALSDVHYLSIDMVWENLFGHPERGTPPSEHLE